MVKSKRVTQTQNPLWDQGFKNPRRQWSSNEDTTRKSVEGDEPPISKGRFISVICLKKCLWTWRNLAQWNYTENMLWRGEEKGEWWERKKENVTGWNSVACFDTCQTQQQSECYDESYERRLCERRTQRKRSDEKLGNELQTEREKLQTRNNPSPQFYYKFTHILRLCAKGELLQIKKSKQEHYMNTNHWIISSYCDHNSFLTFLSGYMWNSAVLPEDKTLNWNQEESSVY